MTTLRLATYNIHKFVGTDGRRDPARVLAVLRAIDADVVAIQEFQTHAVRHTGGPDADAFARQAGYAVLQQPVRRVAGDFQANLVLTRLPVRHQRFLDLRSGRSEPRGAICADLDAGPHGLRVVATHLGLVPGARGKQLRRILEECRAHEGHPFVLMGDLNAWIPWGPVDRRLRREFRGHLQPPSFPAARPVLPLDRIVMRPGRAIRRVVAHAAEPAPVASDHLPVVADIVLD